MAKTLDPTWTSTSNGHHHGARKRRRNPREPDDTTRLGDPPPGRRIRGLRPGTRQLAQINRSRAITHKSGNRAERHVGARVAFIMS